MVKVLVSFYSKGGNTEKMAKALAEGAKEVEGVEVELKRVEETGLEDLISADAIALGSPTYYGLLAAPVKRLLDESVKIHGKLEGKVGIAFTTSGGTATGAETTLLSILQAFLVHGMIVQGDSKDKHYGPAATGTPNAEDLRLCKERGRNIALLALKLSRS
ncbi:NAD(P)H-dependent oxidoreductase [Candidatus Bathyarchaeota archaeon]|nr:NAD(P)H-dependent oxidoreductase [Candidatus Bathyarchaeota archaeon]MBS7627279.1 NAD(P)H-dependent oxidoreductase [Candidatus Bathyarchaeota archaeon]